MLRGLVLLLLLANALFFAWARGWLGPAPHHAEREPERLAAQVRPEALKLLPPVAASAAVQAARAAAVANGYACLQEIAPAASAPWALAQVALPLVQALLRFERRGFEPLVAAYARRDLLRGHAVTTTAPDAQQGVAEGVDEQGALRVRSVGADEALQRIVSGEVSVRLGHL